MTGAVGRAWPIVGWANIVLHLVGLVLAAVLMRPGTPMVPLPDRQAYLGGSPFGWTLGWVTWAVCAILLLAWLALVAARFALPPAATALALALCASGLAVDLTCDTLWIALVPGLAARAAPAFVPVERALTLGGVVVANGLYSLAVLVVTLALPASTGRLVRLTGLASVCAGLVMAAAGAWGNPWAIAATTGPTIFGFVVWVLLLLRVPEPAAR